MSIVRRASRPVLCGALVLLAGVSCKAGGGGTDAVSSGDGGSDATPLADSSVGPRKRVFVTSAAPVGDLYGNNGGGPTEGDRICQQGADSAGLGGTFVVWLSTPTTDAIDRINDVGPWYLVDRVTLLFQNKAELLIGPRVPIDRDELGTLVPPNVDSTFVWTGTRSDGTAAADTCLGFTDFLADGMVGRSDRTDGTWTEAELRSCATYLHLYCIEQ